MEIHCIYGRSYDSNIYIIVGESPTIIDCGTGLHHNEVAKVINNLIDPTTITQIILTHEHYDHCGGVKKLHELTGGNAKIIAHKDAADKIEKGKSMFARMLGGIMPKMPVDIRVDEGDTLNIGDELFEVIRTPGHTPGYQMMHVKLPKTGTVVLSACEHRGHYYGIPIHGYAPGIPHAFSYSLSEELHTLQRIKAMVEREKGQIFVGHDWEQYMELKNLPEYYE